MLKKLLCTICTCILLHINCAHANKGSIVIGTSALYPPFEYIKRNQLKGFDIDLAYLVAEELGAKAEFEDMQFSTLLLALQSNNIDMAIATLTSTEKRQKNFDFSVPYYFESISAIFKDSTQINSKHDLGNKIIATQLGSTMSIWVKNNFSQATLIEFNEATIAVEAVKSGHADVALVDSEQSCQFSSFNPGLKEKFIERSNNGYAIALKKGSKLLPLINEALEKLKNNGKLHEITQKWMNNEEKCIGN